MDFWLIVLTIVGGVLGIYLFGKRNLDYFEKFGIPHVQPKSFFGNVTAMFFPRKSLSDAIQEVYDHNSEAKYVGFYNFSTAVILLKDPELMKSITIKNFDSFTDHQFFNDITNDPLLQKNLLSLKGDVWRDMRTLLSPAFTSSKMKGMFEILSKCAIDFGDHLAKQNPQPEALDMKDTFSRYTLDVIASAAFGITVDSMKYRDNDFYLHGKEVANMSGLKMIKFFFMMSCPWLAKLLNIRFVDDKAADFFCNAIRTTIATRDAQGIVRPDMIHLMMQARDKNDKSPLSIEDMTAQAFIFLLGGFEAPSTTMSYAAHALATHPDVQRKLQAEIDEVLENSSGRVSYEDLHAMKYLDMVVSESLRIFPANGGTDRVCTKSFTLPPALPGLEPLQINPGQSFWLPMISIHRDPKYYRDPETFDPERFSEENKSEISPLTYFPFGFGPRNCIGNRFAVLEVKLVLFYLLAKCNLLPSSKTGSPFELNPKSFNIMPKDGFWLKVEPRK